MKRKWSLLAGVLTIAVAGCLDDPRRNTMPPPGGEPSGYNGTAGVSTMRYEEEAQQARELEARRRAADRTTIQQRQLEAAR